MPRRTLNPSPLQVNNLIAELPERRERITASVKFRDELLKHQERSNYINDYDRLKGLIARSKVRPLESQSVVKLKTDNLMNQCMIFINDNFKNTFIVF